MCRFVAYLGKKSIPLNEILDKPNNSLINQSRQAREGKLGLNADGFGIGWYEHSIDDAPGLFKSIQPAWNDANLSYLAKRVRSTCFIGHVRASTVGDVNMVNCHPFVNEDLMFAHNGTIYGFDDMRRTLLNTLSNEQFNTIQGHTDSEFFFALLKDKLNELHHQDPLECFYEAFNSAVQDITTFQAQQSQSHFSRMNTVLTNGKTLFATRHISDTEQAPLSLHYALGDYIDTENNGNVIHDTNRQPGAILVASEPLTDYAKEWQEVPLNHALLISEDLQIILKPIAV